MQKVTNLDIIWEKEGQRGHPAPALIFPADAPHPSCWMRRWTSSVHEHIQQHLQNCPRKQHFWKMHSTSLCQRPWHAKECNHVKQHALNSGRGALTSRQVNWNWMIQWSSGAKFGSTLRIYCQIMSISFDAEPTVSHGQLRSLMPSWC